MSPVPDTLRVALRQLRKSPGASVTVVLALSLGIGLSTLMFSLIRGALVPTLPFPDGERIVRLQRGDEAPITARDVELWSTRQRSFEGMGAVSTAQVTIAIEGRGAEPVSGASMDPAVLPLLSVSPSLGRAFTAEDALPGAAAVVLLGHDLWQNRLDGDPGALGRVVRVNGREAEIIGIMPEGFGFPFDEQAWFPLRVDPLRDVLGRAGEEGGTLVFLVGLLREGVSSQAAAEDLSRINAEASADGAGPSDETEPESRVQVVAYTNIFSSSGQRAAIATLMLGVALLVLLVACANVTNVLLARTAARGREVAIRTAMGASRGRIVTHFLTEVALLGGAGAAGGTAIALLGTRIIGDVTAAAPSAPFWIDFEVDLPVLAFVAFVSTLAALAAGLVPALQAARADAHDLMKDGARGASGFRMGRVMRRLIGVEVALSFVLLVGAGLFIRSAANFDRVDFAFDPDEVYQARIRMPETYATSEARALFLDDLQEALSAVPGVQAAALASDVPGIGSAVSVALELEGAPVADPGERPRARSITVGPGYFELFLARVVQGRDFELADRAGAESVAIVNTPFQERYFPGGALGRRVRLLARAGTESDWLTIVGVTTDLMAGGVEGELEEAVYVAAAQTRPPGIMILARPLAEFASLPTPVREALAALDQDVALFDVRPLRAAIDAANSQYTWVSALFLTAGSVALFLAVIGLYGVMAFWVAQRTREIGVRMALGGERSRIVRLVLRQGLVQIAAGLGVGFALAVGLGRVLGAALYEVSPYDPVVYGSILGIMVVAAWLGCWVPARRATGIDPLEALAEE